jgi:N-acyl-D-aspartate/D-glutamate deacylase
VTTTEIGVETMLDIAIRGGEVIDGSGSARYEADVGIQGERIVAVGQVGEAAAEIDASGMIVSPGFIDVHTHFDAQVFWDGQLTPSPLHGVTTALGGNCGFTIAPLSADATDSDYLMRMLARVEGMPLETLQAAVPWGTWASTSEYLDVVDGRLGINAGFMTGHSAIRRTVMGRESTMRVATAEELSAMKRLLHDGLEAGALGFSSSWARTHNGDDGRMVPSRYASRDEILALCSVLEEHDGTSLEFIPMVGPFEPWATDLMAEMSVAAQRPLNWNVMVVRASNLEESMKRLEASSEATQQGGKVVGLTIPMGIATRLSFASGFVLDAIPGWEEAMLLPRAEKLAILSDPIGRRRLDDATRQPSNTLPGITDWSTKMIYDVVASENEQYRGRLVGEIAADMGRDPFDVLCDIAIADDLLTSFGTPPPVDTKADWEARLAVWRDGRAVVGGSDAGAHLDLLATFNYTTVMLEEAVRRHDILSLEEAVHLLTDVQAQLYGIRERGRVTQGWYADLVVFDPLRVGSEQVSMRFDLPGGAGRLYAGANGIGHVLVNGRPVVIDGELTGALNGQLLRSGRDTATPSLGQS